MKIVYFYQYFSTPKGSWGTRVYEFCKEWVAQGHEVVVVTSVYCKSDIKATRFLESQNIEGIDLKIININIDNKKGKVLRIIDFVLFSCISVFYALFLKYDTVIVSSGPITVSIPGLVAKILLRKKLVFEVRDLWPRGAIELGVIKNKALIKLSYFFEEFTYKKSDLIVGLSDGICQDICNRYAYNDKCVTVTNAVNLELFKENFNSSLKLNYRYAIYSGNIGVVNNSTWLLDAAREIANRKIDDIKIVVIGDGPLRAEIQEKIILEKLNSIVIYDLMPKIELAHYLQEAMCSLVPLKGLPVLDASSPNKFFESLGAGVPVVQNTEGWMKEFLDTHKVGITIPPDDSKTLVEVLIYYKNQSSSDRLELQARCKTVGAMFCKKKLANKMLASILKI